MEEEGRRGEEEGMARRHGKTKEYSMCVYQIDTVRRLKLDASGDWVEDEAVPVCFKSSTLPALVHMYMGISPTRNGPPCRAVTALPCDGTAPPDSGPAPPDGEPAPGALPLEP
ncbi:unnamed protein product [Arctia plantaginis]|uniref:Uncharacterized protein n=1 Tax=Arctia plantaginis TaxID=874455 RepID=A0A8S1A256_ARCPL|nr:unnamed protein product [Arctia plantaginis]